MKKEKKSETIQIHLSQKKIHEKKTYDKILKESENLGISKSAYVKLLISKALHVDVQNTSEDLKIENKIDDSRKEDILKGLKGLKKKNL